MFLEREPTNKYDPRAIKVGVFQSDQYMGTEGPAPPGSSQYS